MATANTTEPTPSTSPTDFHLQDILGDPLTEKLPNTFRLLSQNVNGISPSNEFNKWKEILQSIVTHNIDVACFSETNVEWRNTVDVLAEEPEGVGYFFGQGVS